MADQFVIDGKIAVVTGGSSGIGQATVLALRNCGASVAVLDIQAPEDDSCDLYVQCDVTSFDSMVQAIEAVNTQLGEVSVLHLNAGIMTRAPSDDITDSPIDLINSSRYQKLVDINFHGPLLGLKAAINSLRRAEGSTSIVITASISGLSGQPFDPFYSMSKHAVVGMVRSFAPVLASDAININAICPGGVVTPIVPTALAAVVGKFMQPSAIADSVVSIVKGGGTGGIWVKNSDSQPLINADANGDALALLFARAAG
jgi:NAD(P)-dependent dehydrogenase (short-subunit alcohol dehydrogenase family)